METNKAVRLAIAYEYQKRRRKRKYTVQDHLALFPNISKRVAYYDLEQLLQVAKRIAKFKEDSSAKRNR